MKNLYNNIYSVLPEEKKKEILENLAKKYNMEVLRFETFTILLNNLNCINLVLNEKYKATPINIKTNMFFPHNRLLTLSTIL